MKQLDWYNEADVYVLARVEAGTFIQPTCPRGQEHFNILRDHYFNLWVYDFDSFRDCAGYHGFEAVRSCERD